MEDTKQIVKFKDLQKTLQETVTVVKIPHPFTENAQAVFTRLPIIEGALLDTTSSFNASEQIKSLHHAQHELSLMINDLLVLQEGGQLTLDQYNLCVRKARELDLAIRELSDPEFSE